MKKAGFLIGLHKEKKLQTVEPSEELKEAYVQKSSASIKSAEILLQNSLLENSVPMAYYSMYNMIMALFFKISRKEVENLILIAKEFNSSLYDFIDRMTSKDVDRFRDKLKEILG